LLGLGLVAKAASPSQSGPWEETQVELDRPIPRVYTAPWQHQREAFWSAYPYAGYGLFMDMGTGKTKVVIDLIVNRNHRQVLVLAPKAVVADDHTWSKNFNLHAPDYADVLELGGYQSVAKKVEMAQAAIAQAKAMGRPVVIVINWQAAREDAWATWSVKAGFDLAVADEASILKKPGGRTSRYAWKLAQAIPYRLALTGTPMPHSPLDAYGIFRFIDASIFGTNYVIFRARYAVMHPKFPKVIQWLNQEEMNAKVYSRAYRVLSDDVLDLPPYHHLDRETKLGSKAQQAYQELWKDLVTVVKGQTVSVDNVLVRLLRVQQITSGFLPLPDGTETQIDDAKEQLLEEALDELAHDEPVVVFCRFVHDLDLVQQVTARLSTVEAPRRYAEVSGRTNKAAGTLQDFQEGRADVIAVQIQAGGFGIDLTRARYAFYYSLGFSLGDYEQSLKRVHRPGQTRATTFLHLLAGAVDRRVYQALRDRKDVVSAILDAARSDA
jgi:superfamily II DNA or RNA helicase